MSRDIGKNKTTDVPVFFVHFHFRDELKVPVLQAAQMGNRVIFLGDSTCKVLESIPGVEFHDAYDYLKSTDIAEFIQSYVHMSSNDAKIELICFLRWFAIKNFLLAHNLDCCFYADSDVMVFFNADDEIKDFKNYEAGLLMEDQTEDSMIWCAAGSISYWTKTALENLASFMIDQYRDPNKFSIIKGKYDWHLAKNEPGGVVDMTVKYRFVVDNPEIKIKNLTHVCDGASYDINVNYSDNYHKGEYLMSGEMKKLRWINNKPSGFNVILNSWVELKSLHFQGGLKNRIAELIEHSKNQKNE